MDAVGRGYNFNVNVAHYAVTLHNFWDKRYIKRTGFGWLCLDQLYRAPAFPYAIGQTGLYVVDELPVKNEVRSAAFRGG